MVTDGDSSYITITVLRHAITSPRVSRSEHVFTMIILASIVVLATVIQTISSQDIPPPPPPFPSDLPEACRGPPVNASRPHECCKIPPFFSDDDFKECGFKKHGDGGGPGPGGRRGPGHRRGPPDCSKQLCMLKKYDLLDDETAVSHEKVTGFLDKWAETNTEFKSAIDTAKDRCLGKELPGPPHICEANKLVFCISSTLFEECPTWETNDGCKNLKDHMTECAPFFKPRADNKV